MHQNIEGNEKFENYCMAFGLDNVSFQQFEFISNSKCWNDFMQSIKLFYKICDSLKINDLITYFTVAPSFNPELMDTITYDVCFDDDKCLFLSLDISHNVINGTYSIYITEYDSRFCESKERPAYHYSNIFGPFTDEMPLNNQDLYERCRLWHTKISKHLRTTTNVSN